MAAAEPLYQEAYEGMVKKHKENRSMARRVKKGGRKPQESDQETIGKSDFGYFFRFSYAVFHKWVVLEPTSVPLTSHFSQITRLDEANWESEVVLEFQS